MSTRLARFCVAAASSATLVLAVAGSAAWSQAAPTVKVDPTSGLAGSTFTITMNNYKACPANTSCIIIDFIQGATTTRIGTADSRGSATFNGQVKVPPGALPGPADVRAHVPEDATQDAKAGFTVLPPAATTTAPTTTSTSSSSTTLTTLLPPTTAASTTSTTEAPTTTTTVKKDDEHSDAPRYIAVGLVVAAALATAIVDSRMRRLRG